jgi:hypothetical protein
MNGEGKLQPNSSENPKTNLIVGTDSKGQARVYFKAPDSTDDVTQIEATTGYGDLQKKNSFTMKTVAATPGVTAANPFALSNMQAMLNPDGSVTLTWDNNPDNLDPIPIKVEQPDGTWSVVATVPPGSTSFLIPPQ